MLYRQKKEAPCPVCGEATSRHIQVLGLDMVVSVRCQCAREKARMEENALEKSQASMRLRDLRRSCFLGSSYAAHTFAVDDRYDPKLSEAMQRYASEWERMKGENMGLLLYGPVGSGKTFYAAAIANALMEKKGVRSLMTNFSTVIMKMQGMYSGKLDYLEHMIRTPLLILDDLGTERQSEFMLEQVYTIVDARYRIQLPLIVTTNLDMGEIKYPKDLTYCRIYDRILSMCHPVKVDSPSRRRQALIENYARHNALLGSEEVASV